MQTREQNHIPRLGLQWGKAACAVREGFLEEVKLQRMKIGKGGQSKRVEWSGRERVLREDKI